ncbi:hypothetical protein chiPu_0027340 [Chiloscyllium punctatum]|uniref:Uncharacterized protein n=1 Tax=Chiloscyllium punctatum TaxID=137246 RepID=A0A401TL09_CHIPU|nr:hypothetical protein [Chiloscyllium punctatum]
MAEGDVHRKPLRSHWPPPSNGDEWGGGAASQARERGGEPSIQRAAQSIGRVPRRSAIRPIAAAELRRGRDNPSLGKPARHWPGRTPVGRRPPIGGRRGGRARPRPADQAP